MTSTTTTSLSLIFSLYIILLSTSLVNASVAPIFNCWFYTYNELNPNNVQRNYNIIFGYNNSEGKDIIVAIDGTNNVIYPASYNGNQPYIFKNGVYQLMYTVKDTSNVLNGVNAENSFISWKIGNEITKVTHNDLSNENQCKNRFNNVCPLWIDHFCEDSSFCNGKEICFTVGFSGVLDPYSQYGSCKKTSNSFQCSNPSNEHCSEDALKCIQNTNTPTTSSPSSNEEEQPTDTPPTDAPSDSPTDAPTEEEEEEETNPPTPASIGSPCNINEDCSLFPSFCKGNLKCDVLLKKCIQADINYNGCQSQQDKLDEYLKLQNKSNHGDNALIITCVEHARLCVQSFTCTENSDCDDGNICNGKETCNLMSGLCSSASDQSIVTVCGSDKMTCTSDKGCVAKQSHDDNGLSDAGILALIILICIGVGVILVVLVVFSLYYGVYMRNSKKKKKAKTT